MSGNPFDKFDENEKVVEFTASGFGVDVEISIPLGAGNIKFSTNDFCFNPDLNSIEAMSSSLDRVKSLRVRLIAAYNELKPALEKQKIQYNNWLAQIRTALRNDNGGKSFKNLEEAQDALYLNSGETVMQYEQKLISLSSLCNLCESLLDLTKDLMFSYNKVLEALYRERN
jgi:hypothetical protein